jgi:hypothetical protein
LQRLATRHWQVMVPLQSFKILKHVLHSASRGTDFIAFLNLHEQAGFMLQT